MLDNFKERNHHLCYEACQKPAGLEGKTQHGVTELHRVKILKRDDPRRREEDRVDEDL